MNEDWKATNVNDDRPKLHETAVICEGRDERARDSQHPDDEAGWKYTVVLLEWHGDGGMGQRVRWVSIDKSDLNQALGQGPVRKEFILG